MGSPAPPIGFNRDAIVAAVDLASLADELLGPYAGTEQAPSWPCPNPEHPQTGRTPPVTVFAARNGDQRWHCHGCGNHGTALDLVMQVRGVDVRAALEDLAQRSGLPANELTGASPAGRRRPGRPPVPPAADAPQPVPVLEAYVAQCAAALWEPEAAPIRAWLTRARGLPDDVLRANRIGADLGTHRQPRPIRGEDGAWVLGWAGAGIDAGVPRVRRAVVLPVLVDGQACYAQLRPLGWVGGPKYLHTRADLAANPRVGLIQAARSFDIPFARRDLIVTEGIIDGLSAAAGGYGAAAVLSANYADPVAAATLTRQRDQLVVAFDPDPAGRAGAERLVRLLNAQDRRPGVMLLGSGDLNDHLVAAQDWPLELAGRVQHATARLGLLPLHTATGTALPQPPPTAGGHRRPVEVPGL
ncbi:MAG TPA: toprim domain-containing protein [Acidimicrobiales bacterium]|nr:toprim domain-containing protein [Acidimicrobiales bacterium]